MCWQLGGTAFILWSKPQEDSTATSGMHPASLCQEVCRCVVWVCKKGKAWDKGQPGLWLRVLVPWLMMN